MSDERFSVEDELGAYLLGALSPEEEERVERLLATSESARDRLRWMQPAVEMLGETVERREPPPELRDRILHEVGADTVAPKQRVETEPKRAWFRLGGFSLQPAFGLALVALALVLAGFGLVHLDIGSGGGGTRTFASHNAELKVEGDHGTLKLTKIDPIPPNQDYQAWVQRDGRMIPSSLFGGWKNGTATAAIPHDLNGASAVVVTSEPKGGSRAPTGPRLATISLSS